MENKMNRCDRCKQLVKPSVTYGIYPANFCFNCWQVEKIDQNGMPAEASMTEVEYCSSAVERCHDKVVRAEQELKLAIAVLDRAERRLASTVNNQAILSTLQVRNTLFYVPVFVGQGEN
jgi:hypothetical protein